ncbi:MAG: RtcB family protein [Pseudonocardiaceae bacterium]
MINAVPRGTRGETAMVIRHLDGTGSAELDAAPVGELLAQIATLPDLTRIDVYPDITRKIWGFPSGVSTISAGRDPIVYPMAVPDVACGFLVVATGVPATSWHFETRHRFLEALIHQIGVGSPNRAPVRIDLDAVFSIGAAALGPPTGFDDTDVVEQTTNCIPRPDLVLAPARADLAAEAGSAAGHFVCLYAADPATTDSGVEPGEIVLVVHTGAPALREQFFTTHVLPMAELCVNEQLLPLDAIEQGLFGLPLSHPLASEFLSLTACSVHWGQANRQLVADRILDLMAAHAPPAIQRARLIRHVGHCSYQVHPTAQGASVTTARGVQPLTAHRDGLAVPAPPTFITGGSHTLAYLVHPGPRAGEHGNSCPHGTPQWTPLHTPASITTSPHTRPDPARIEAVAANTSPDHDYQRRHLINLEATITALTNLGIATPAARLAPLVNYRELRHD